MDTLPTSGVWQSYERIACGYIAYLWGMAVLREDSMWIHCLPLGYVSPTGG